MSGNLFSLNLVAEIHTEDNEVMLWRLMNVRSGIDAVTERSRTNGR